VQEGNKKAQLMALRLRPDIQLPPIPYPEKNYVARLADFFSPDANLIKSLKKGKQK
jgi:hypothetical protein